MNATQEATNETTEVESLPSDAPQVDAASQLEQDTCAVEFWKKKFGVNRAFEPENKHRVAREFNAADDSVGCNKRLIAPRDKRVSKVTSVISAASKVWESMTVPFPESKVRLLRTDRIGDFEQRMKALHADLELEKGILESFYDEIKIDATERLDQLYNDGDWPDTIADQYDFGWNFVSVQPPDYLKQLHPAVWERECQRVRSQLESAVSMAEQAYVGELNGLLVHLHGRLQPGPDGNPKTLHRSAIDNVHNFFAKFKEMSIGSNDELEALVNNCESVLSGTSVTDLRSDGNLRAEFAEKIHEVQGFADSLIIDAPTRTFDFDED